MFIYLGRKGIGLTGTKRARSPSAAERLAKMAKMANDMGHRDFRERARDEYNNRRAEGRLGTLCFFQILRPGIWRVFSPPKTTKFYNFRCWKLYFKPY